MAVHALRDYQLEGKHGVYAQGHAGNEDKMLKQRMKSPETLTGVLRWAVEGAMRWYASGAIGLEHPSAVKLATRTHRAELDYVQAWLDERCDEAGGAWTANSALYASYENWCRANGVTPKAIRGLSMALKAKGFTVNDQRKVAGQNNKGVKGLSLSVR
jgi:putative DNA primase/helicase